MTCPVSSSALGAGVSTTPPTMDVSSSALKYRLDKYVNRVDSTISACSVETLVCGSSSDRRTKIRTRFKNGKKLRVMHKLDEEQVRWVLTQKRKDVLSDAESRAHAKS